MVRPAEAGRSARNPIGAVENAMRLLVLVRDRAWISVSEASEELGVSRSTAHRLLSTLLENRVVQQDPDTKAYRGGPIANLFEGFVGAEPTGDPASTSR